MPYTYACAGTSTPTRTHTVGCMGCPGRATVRTRIECAAIQRVILSMHTAVHRATRRAKGGLVVRLRHANKTTLVSCWLGSVRYPWNTHRRLEIGTGTHARNVERLMQHQRPGASMRPACAASSVKRDERPPLQVRAVGRSRRQSERGPRASRTGALARARDELNRPPAKPGTLLQALPISVAGGEATFDPACLSFAGCHSCPNRT